MKKQKRFAIEEWDKHFVRMNLIFWHQVLRENNISPRDSKNIHEILKCLKAFPQLDCKINNEISATYRVKNNPYTGLIEHDCITKIYRDESNNIHLVFTEKWITTGAVVPNDKYSEVFHTSTSSKILKVTDGFTQYDAWIHALSEILLLESCSNYEVITTRL